MSEPIYRIPPDWTIKEVHTPYTEIHDWSLNFLGIPDLWRYNKGQINGEPIVVCVLDTGCDLEHEDLSGAIIDAKDFTNSRRGPSDSHGHGTWCCGFIGARANNDIGVKGVAPECKILVAKVLGDNGAGTDKSIGDGMEWGLGRGAQFFSLSLGGPRMSGWLHNIFQDAARTNRFPFAASGNDGGPVNFPGAWKETIGVGAVDRNGKMTDFTSRGPELDILAPGVDMVSTIPNGYGAMTGTSMACPCACAVGVLAYGKHSEKGGATDLKNIIQMREHLKRTADTVNGGPGLIDPDELMMDDSGTPPSIPGWEATFGPLTVRIPAQKGDDIGLSWEQQ